LYTRTTMAVIGLLTASALLTGCSSGGSDPKPTTVKQTAATAPTTTAPTPEPTYSPEEWRWRVDLLIEDLDAAQPGCKRHPSSDECAAALEAANETITEMDTALDRSASAAEYPATVDHIRRNILAGYNKYIADDCQGNPLADGYSSDCRGDVVLVMLGVATLPAKMTVDGP